MKQHTGVIGKAIIELEASTKMGVLPFGILKFVPQGGAVRT